MGSYTNFIRGRVKANPSLKLRLKKAGLSQTPFQYIHQTLFMTLFSYIAVAVIVFLFFKKNLLLLILFEFLSLFLIPIIYSFWLSYVDVQIRKYARDLDGDLLFISEYFLVSLESGLPLGNAIERFSRLKRPGGKFFKTVYTEFQTGKDLETALNDASVYSPSDSLRILLKRLHDSLTIGVDLKVVLENYIKESSDKKIVEIKGYSKKLNPIIMMYLLIGIVLPSLGITFFILGATVMSITPTFLKYILIFTFLIMFLFQYMSYSAFKFSRSTL